MCWKEAIDQQKSIIAGLEAQIEAVKIARKEWDDLIQTVSTGRQKLIDLQSSAFGKMAEGSLKLTTRPLDADVNAALFALDAESLQRNLGLLQFQRPSQEQQAQDFLYSWERQMEARAGDVDLRGIRDRERRGVGLFGLQASLSGVGEGDQINTLHNLRLQYASQEYEALKVIAEARKTEDEREQARADAEEMQHQKLFDADMERNQALLQIALRQKEAFQNLVVGGLDSLLSGNFGSFLQSQGRNFVNQVAGNAAGLAWSGLSKYIPHTSGTLGKLFEGTAFGPDPLKISTDANTAATIANTAALRSFSLSATGGGAGSVLSSAITLADGTVIGGGAGGGAGNHPVVMPDGTVINTGVTGSAGKFTFAKGVGIAGAAAGGIYGAYSGFSQGNLAGAASGIGALSGATGAILSLAGVTGPAAPILLGVGLGLSMLPGLLPNPKQTRGADIDRQLEAARYTAPDAATYTMDRFGRGFDYDNRGTIRIVLETPITVNTPNAKSFSDYAADIAEAHAEAIEGHLSPRLEAAVRSLVAMR